MNRQLRPIDVARRVGARAAYKLHLRTDTPMDDPIDVFSIIERERIWLVFQPLQNVLGAYQHGPDSPGIIINSRHPPSLQRFTAAHELGHHVLQHVAAVDDRARIEGTARGLDRREVAAQAFAADFLMPLPLVNRTLRDLGLRTRNPELDEVIVYRMAVKLGASYAAMANQLAALGKTSWARAKELKRIAPVRIKALLAGRDLDNARADVWIVRGDPGQRVEVRVEDEIHVLLPQIASSGFVWEVPNSNQGGGLPLIDDSTELATPETGVYGAGATRHFVFRAAEPGQYTASIVKRRPWLESKEVSDSFVAQVDVRSPVTGDSASGLSARQRQLLPIGLS